MQLAGNSDKVPGRVTAVKRCLSTRFFAIPDRLGASAYGLMNVPLVAFDILVVCFISLSMVMVMVKGFRWYLF